MHANARCAGGIITACEQACQDQDLQVPVVMRETGHHHHDIIHTLMDRSWGLGWLGGRGITAGAGWGKVIE